jgi:hypothetical protein
MSRMLSELSPLERFDAIIGMMDQGGVAEHLAKHLCPLSHVAVTVGVHETSVKSELYHRYSALIAGLHAFDVAIEAETSYRGHAYLLGDDALAEFIPASSLESRQSLVAGLEVLSTVGLIYRFNVARKFGYPDRGLMQLRLNSWGRLLVETARLEDTLIFGEIASTCRLKIVSHRRRYEEIFSLCSSENRPLNIAQIHALNSVLPLQVVS